MNTYLIELRGQVDVEELNEIIPHQMSPVRMGPGSTLVTICTDQAGMIGLLRHLHSLGFELILACLQTGSLTQLNEKGEK